MTEPQILQAAPGECDALLRDGGMVHIRPLCQSDRSALHELAERTSDHSAYLRFFSGGTTLAHRYVERLTKPGYRGRALVAWLGDDLVGVAEYIPDQTGRTADVAILVDDRMHGRGLGTLLLEHLAIHAAAYGIREFVAEVLAENLRIQQVLRDVGLDVKRTSLAGEIEIRVALEPTDRLLAAIDARDHEAETASLGRLLRPRSVAVVGASHDPASIGHRIVRNLVEGGFAGTVHPVGPEAGKLLGLPVHSAMADIPGPVDLAIVAVPAEAVLDVARECAEHGVAGLVVLTAGFAETGPDGAGQEARLLAICRRAGMRLIGPNCLGIVNTHASLNAGVLPRTPGPGRMGLMSESRALGMTIVDLASALGPGISSFVSVGNKADVSANDLLQYWEDDPDTAVVALYLGSFGNPRKFGRIARRVGARKPVIVVKSGRAASGEQVVRSHMADTTDVAVDTLLDAAGVIRVDTVQELLDTARLLASQPLPAGPRVAIVGNSGGPAALAADACDRHGLLIAQLGTVTQDTLRARLGAATVGAAGLVDLAADIDADDLAFALRTVMADSEVDAVLAIRSPPFDPGAACTAGTTAIGQAAVAQTTGKTVAACVIGHDELITTAGRPGGVPCYAFPEHAVRALRRAVDYARWRARPVTSPPELSWVDTASARMIVDQELARNPAGCRLDAATAARLLRCYGVHVAESVHVVGPDAAADAAAFVGLPVVLKAAGPDAPHKTDIGGVQLDLQTPGQVREAYREMAQRLGASMTGAIVQRMAGEGVEVVVRAADDPVSGPLVGVGMGGVAAELLADRAFRVPPVTEADAAEMIRELRCAPLLSGYRGRPPVDTRALEGQIVRVGRLVEDFPEIAELDLTPVLVTPGGATAVDVRLRLVPASPVPSTFQRRLR